MGTAAVHDRDSSDDTEATADIHEDDAPLSRRDRRTARTRQAIVDAARALFDEQGFADTTVDQIAERADIAPRTFFRHFSSKEAVIFADYEDYRRQMLELMAARPADEHPLRSVVAGLVEFCEVVARDPDRFSWPFRLSGHQELTYEQTMIKAQTCDRIGGFIAERLDAPPADPRPHTWAVMVMTMFGAAMRSALEVGGTGDPRARFVGLLGETARGLGLAAEHVADVH